MNKNFVTELSQMPWHIIKKLLILDDGIRMEFLSGNGIEAKPPTKEEFDEFIKIAYNHLSKEKIIDGRTKS